jgi:uncharacterized protein (DUF305 family)
MRCRAKSLVALACVLLAAGCGDDQADKPKVRANETDMAFVTEMIPHHERGVDAADLALTRAKHPQIRRSARELLQFQSTELANMRVVRDVLGEAGVEAGDLGVPRTQLDPRELRHATDFDRAYIDQMIPHHELAIRMGSAEREQGIHADLRRTATDVSDLARFQIRQMKRWRRAWYGE